MTGIGRSSEGLDVRRRKLLFRAWHRGLREVDLILGRFADANIEQLTEADLSEFESLMNVPDGVNLVNSCGAAAWQTVFHFHMHVIPRYEGDPVRLPWVPAPGDPLEIAAALMAFTLSFDEVVVTFFTTGRENTLPMVIWSMLRFGLTPEVNAIATITTLASAAFAVVAETSLRNAYRPTSAR